ncbi:MAG TPA: hypothetical protein VJ044_00880 [Candidatus Hodarchaeales archaeon]|nr:hypothetical protein [Candidatus Hodarchaeales archaeon]
MSKRKETKKGEHLEIERKFLLRRVPPVKIMDKILHIDQCYTNSGRFRAVRTGTKFDYIMQKKRQLRPGVYAESAEKKISWNKYASAWKNKKKMLSKIRYMKKDKNGLVWEIDEFVGMNLVIAEVELSRENFKLKLPPFIKKELIMEVTKYGQFRSSQIAE